MKRTVSIIWQSLAGLLLLASFATAGELSGKPFAFADVGLGLRPLGMGGAYTALAVDEHAVRWNPSLLGDVLDPTAGFSWANQFSVVSYNYASISYPVSDIGLGVGAYFLSAGDDVYRETTIGFGAGLTGDNLKLPENILFGSTIKIYLASYGNDPDGGIDRVTGSAGGFGLDLAASWRPSDQFMLALVGRDLINTVSWTSDNIDHSTKGSYSEGVPRVIDLAGAFQDEKFAVSFSVQPSLYADVPTHINFGFEFAMLKVLKPRLGLSQNFGSGDPNRQVSIGLGIDLDPTFTGPIRQIKFGYTHLIHNIDSTPRVGLSVSW